MRPYGQRCFHVYFCATGASGQRRAHLVQVEDAVAEGRDQHAAGPVVVRGRQPCAALVEKVLLRQPPGTACRQMHRVFMGGSMGFLGFSHTAPAMWGRRRPTAPPRAAACASKRDCLRPGGRRRREDGPATSVAQPACLRMQGRRAGRRPAWAHCAHAGSGPTRKGLRRRGRAVRPPPLGRPRATGVLLRCVGCIGCGRGSIARAAHRRGPAGRPISRSAGRFIGLGARARHAAVRPRVRPAEQRAVARDGQQRGWRRAGRGGGGRRGRVREEDANERIAVPGQRGRPVALDGVQREHSAAARDARERTGARR